MSMSFRDQLLQAGLVNEKQTKEAERQLRQQQRERQQLPKQKRAAASDAELAAQRAQLAKTARDQELSRQQKEQADKRARHAQVEQLIQQNCLPRPQTDDDTILSMAIRYAASLPIVSCASGSAVVRSRSCAATAATSSCRQKLQLGFARATRVR